MGTHLIPREIDGDGRILIVFTQEGFIGTLIGIAVGSILYSFSSAFGATLVGWVLLALSALIGFVIGQLKVPESNAFSLFKKTGGEYIRDVIANYLAFRRNRKIYMYDETDYGATSNTSKNSTTESIENMIKNKF